MLENPRIIKVAVPTPLRRAFDYLCPQPLPDIGCRVMVPFGKQKLVALVIAHPEDSTIEYKKLKTIHQIIDKTPLLPHSLFMLVQWAAKYYQHPIGDAFHSCLPTLLNKGEPAKLTQEYIWKITEQGQNAVSNLKKNAIKQKKIMQLAIGLPEITESILSQSELTKSQLKPLVDKGWLQALSVEPIKTKVDLYKSPPLSLNDEQTTCVNKVNEQLNQFKGFLLKGVTGSGKTEVYLQIIAEVLKQGHQALVLVPEIGLTPQTVKRFEARFNQKVAMLHSGLTDRQRLNIWLQAQQGLVSIIIGTRSSIFTPFFKLGLIVVDEEHDLSYKQQEGFRYSARDLALLRAQYEDIPVILGSATPSMESLSNVSQGKLALLTLNQRAANATPPHIKVLDVRQRYLEQGLSQPLIERINHHLSQGNQCLIFLNRRGYAPSLLCHDCGWLADCQRCDRHMTYHHQFKRLHCHHCDKQLFVPKQCPECKSPHLLPIGMGTERLQEVLEQKFPDKKVIRIDRDTTRNKLAMQQFIEQIKNDEVDILVGTQMLAKGHHFPKLTLVGVIDIDSCLFSADFRATERTAQLLTQVAGRAGRSVQQGEVIIQTHHPENPLLINLFTQDYQTLSEQILAEREAAMLPPFHSMALLRAESNHLQQPMEFLQKASSLFSNNHQHNVSCFGPFPAPMPKRAGKLRAQLLIQANHRKHLQLLLQYVIPQIEQLPEAKKVRWSIDVDPQEIF